MPYVIDFFFPFNSAVSPICEFVYSSIFIEQLVNLRTRQLLWSRGNYLQRASTTSLYVDPFDLQHSLGKLLLLSPLYTGGTEAQGT